MIRTVIYGFSKNPELKAELKQCAEFAIKELLPKKRKLTIHIKGDSSLLKKYGAYGLCWESGDPHYFYIDLHSVIEKHELLPTLLHEMVHVKQFCKRELVNRHDSRIWLGKRYEDSDCEWSTPWEKEARKLEKNLYQKYLNQKTYK
jgi:hypothetical protein